MLVTVPRREPMPLGCGNSDDVPVGEPLGEWGGEVVNPSGDKQKVRRGERLSRRIDRATGTLLTKAHAEDIANVNFLSQVAKILQQVS